MCAALLRRKLGPMRSALSLIITLAATLVVAGPASAGTVLDVAEDGRAVACDQASAENPFGSLADALRCAVAGDQVRLGPGHFDGQVAIDADVSLRGAGAAQTVISPPASGPFEVANVTVGAGHRVTI